MRTLTNERAIAQQFLIEHWDKPLLIPDWFSGWGNRIADAEIDGREYSLTLYQFNYGKQKGMAKGLWLLSDLAKRGIRHNQLGVKLA